MSEFIETISEMFIGFNWIQYMQANEKKLEGVCSGGQVWDILLNSSFWSESDPSIETFVRFQGFFLGRIFSLKDVFVQKPDSAAFGRLWINF